jgi:hypothetical protein
VPEQKYLLVALAHEAGKPIPALIAEALDDAAYVGDRCRLVQGGAGSPAHDIREGKFPGDDARDPSLPCPRYLGPALHSAHRCDSLEECDDGFCKDVIAITGDHMGSVCHIDILGVWALFEETLGPCLT